MFEVTSFGRFHDSADGRPESGAPRRVVGQDVQVTSPPSSAVRRPGLGLVVMLAVLAMIGPFTIDTIFPGFGAMSAELEASDPAMQQLISAYMLSLAVMSLLHGPLSDALGRKPVVIGACIGYALTAVGCALAPSFGALLGMRVAQGVFAGAGTIVGRAIIRDLFDTETAQRLLSQVAMVFGIAPAVAPIVGGLLVPHGWRTIFWFLAALGAVLAVAATFGLPESLPREERRPLRLRPVLAAVAERFRDLPTSLLAVATGLNFGTMFVYVASAPAFVEDILGRDEQDYWVLFVPLIGGMVLGSAAAGRLSRRMRPGRMASLGLAITLVAGLANVGYTLAVETVAFPLAVLGQSVSSFGIALTFPVMILAILDRAPHARGAAASVQAFTQLLLSAVVSSTLSPLVAHSALALAVSAWLLSVAAGGLWAWHVLVNRRSIHRLTID